MDRAAGFWETGRCGDLPGVGIQVTCSSIPLEYTSLVWLKLAPVYPSIPLGKYTNRRAWGGLPGTGELPGVEAYRLWGTL